MLNHRSNLKYQKGHQIYKELDLLPASPKANLDAYQEKFKILRFLMVISILSTWILT